MFKSDISAYMPQGNTRSLTFYKVKVLCYNHEELLRTYVASSHQETIWHRFVFDSESCSFLPQVFFLRMQIVDVHVEYSLKFRLRKSM